MTKHECAVIMAYTGVCMLTGDDLKYFYDYIAELMGRPVFSHEIPALSDDLIEKAKPDFIRLCREAAEPKKKTNGDRIRHMTDEELAALIANENDFCSLCAYNSDTMCYKLPEACSHGFYEWLKQEVSEDA